MTDPETQPSFYYIKLFVTGHSEKGFLPQFLKSLQDSGRCAFVRPQKIGQLSPRNPVRKLKMVNSGKPLSSRQEDLALKARKFVGQGPNFLALIVDDLEDRQDRIDEVYETYREPLDKLLSSKGLENQASVQFLVPMLEAYYFTNIVLVNDILNIGLDDSPTDPETISNPKAILKQAVKARDKSRKFDEKADGAKIARKLDLGDTLSDPTTCKSLRSLVKWCVVRIGDDISDKYQLEAGAICPCTIQQV